MYYFLVRCVRASLFEDCESFTMMNIDDDFMEEVPEEKVIDLRDVFEHNYKMKAGDIMVVEEGDTPFSGSFILKSRGLI